MITSRQKGEGQKPQHSPSRLRNPFRSTNYTTHRSPKPQSLHSSPPARIDHTTDVASSTTTIFMKNYVGKLKRQHRRERRRVMANSNRHEKQEAGVISGDSLPFVRSSHQRMLILQKIQPGTFNRQSLHPIPSATTMDVPPLSSISKQVQYYKQRLMRERLVPQKNSTQFDSLLPLKKRSISEKLPQVRTQRAFSAWHLDPWEGQPQQRSQLMDYH